MHTPRDKDGAIHNWRNLASPCPGKPNLFFYSNRLAGDTAANESSFSPSPRGEGVGGWGPIPQKKGHIFMWPLRGVGRDRTNKFQSIFRHNLVDDSWFVHHHNCMLFGKLCRTLCLIGKKKSHDKQYPGHEFMAVYNTERTILIFMFLISFATVWLF